jgi:hypothetical protein
MAIFAAWSSRSSVLTGRNVKTLDLDDQAAKMAIFQQIIDKSKSLRKEPTAYFSKEIRMSYNKKND